MFKLTKMSFCSKILRDLVHLRTLRCLSLAATSSVPGAGSFLEVVEAIDGPILLNECVNGGHECSIKSCVMRKIWRDAQEDLVNRLESTNFGDLIKQKVAVA